MPRRKRHRNTHTQSNKDLRRQGSRLNGPSPTLELTGRRKGRRYIVVSFGAEVALPDAEFDAFCRLAAARLANCRSVPVKRVYVHRINQALKPTSPHFAARAPLICPCPKSKGCYMLAWPQADIRVHESFADVILRSNAGAAAVRKLRKHIR